MAGMKLTSDPWGGIHELGRAKKKDGLYEADKASQRWYSWIRKDQEERWLV
jgi:hypothetical protein